MWVSVQTDLSESIYNKLKSNPIIQNQLGGRVFDSVQKDAVYPYIIVGETNVTNKESTTSMREDVGIIIHVYSQTKTKYEVNKILQFLGLVLNREIDLKDYEFIRSRIDDQQVFDDVDQFTKHGIIRLLFKYRHKTKYEGV
ncbi:DUF3168 domain-containing protein [Staphylococcus saprophyticus]|uniref:DUF3168 domain-containing protein n=1 Tax=Staphylococcus saprophyticus TaxID=29385 RepID=UPI0009909F90|nr:DUF3168 domain-containing protein [Staphylococcus saprophyticus]MDW3788505.1 DUF3168 domain-containing protein [Staphylococcus saprophyticus]MDW3863824.1 DUF3168 domain-containing protein [Staphylococcus saprophyticus]MDW4034566.1 DUF3168 domain-containing protein [Staphylococcus saprophyticus]MDW4128388.1 DUF3168 domain-containing protein [Staphylococcus saprophyticus]MDW4184669.1 DUF3168 domain-containing protein [Staphylococcus saprophyticus]